MWIIPVSSTQPSSLWVGGSTNISTKKVSNMSLSHLFSLYSWKKIAGLRCALVWFSYSFFSWAQEYIKCSGEIKRRLILGKKAMTKIEMIMKDKNILMQQRSTIMNVFSTVTNSWESCKERLILWIERILMQRYKKNCKVLSGWNRAFNHKPPDLGLIWWHSKLKAVFLC